MEWLLQAPILLFSLILHEFSHGLTAHRRGDDTAALSGRLSFHPLDHVDPIGTVLVPMICVLKGLPMFGWARPVPVNPALLRSPRWDLLAVAAAGPISNVLLATAAILVLRVVAGSFVVESGLAATFAWSLLTAAQINLLLAFFNLIPVFPLDGSKVLGAVLPDRWLRLYEEHTPYGGFIVLLLVATGAAGLFVVPGMRLMFGLYRLVGLL